MSLRDLLEPPSRLLEIKGATYLEEEEEHIFYH